jgi:hypothetical protein
MDEKLTAILAELRRRLEALYGPRLVRLVPYSSTIGHKSSFASRSKNC